MKPLALAAATYCAMSLLAVTVWAVVAPRLLRDEDAHSPDCTCPAHDVGPDDLEAVAEAVGVLAQDAAARMDDYVLSLTAPLSWELAKTPGVRAMTLIDRAAFLATARDIDSLPIYRGGRG